MKELEKTVREILTKAQILNREIYQDLKLRFAEELIFYCSLRAVQNSYALINVVSHQPEGFFNQRHVCYMLDLTTGFYTDQDIVDMSDIASKQVIETIEKFKDLLTTACILAAPRHTNLDTTSSGIFLPNTVNGVANL